MTDEMHYIIQIWFWWKRKVQSINHLWCHLQRPFWMTRVENPIGFRNTTCGHFWGSGDYSLMDTASLWSQPFLFNSPSPLCVCVCLCLCAPKHVYKTEVNLRWHFSGTIHLCIETGSLTGIWNLPIRQGWLERKPQVPVCPHLPHAGIISIHYHTWIIMWVLGVEFQPSGLCRKLYPLPTELPAPSLSRSEDQRWLPKP